MISIFLVFSKNMLLTAQFNNFQRGSHVSFCSKSNIGAWSTLQAYQFILVGAFLHEEHLSESQLALCILLELCCLTSVRSSILWQPQNENYMIVNKLL